MVVSNNSGCSGAALTKRLFGDSVAFINTKFPHWFNGPYKTYNNKEETLPFDQHMLLSLIAPRPLYVASAHKDHHADPRGEFLSIKACSEVYSLFGYKSMVAIEMPPVDTPIQADRLAYHLRQGKHDITSYDWAQFMNFADKQFGK